MVGASGFIGSALARELACDNEVFGLARFRDSAAADSLRQCGIHLLTLNAATDSLALVPTDFDYVFIEVLLVLGADEQPRQAFEVNSFIVARFLEHCRGCKGFVVGSTGSVYRVSAEKATESFPLGGNTEPGHNLYVLSRICGDMFASYFAQWHGIPVAILRYYYPYSESAGIVTSYAQSIREGVMMENSPVLLNPIFLPDLVAFTIAASRECSTKPTIINVGGDEVVSKRELALRIAKVMGRQALFAEPSGHVSSSWICDNGKRRKLLGEQNVSLEKGIRRALGYNG